MNNTLNVDLEDPNVVAYWREHMGVGQDLLCEIVAKVGDDPGKVAFEVGLKMADAVGGIAPRRQS